MDIILVPALERERDFSVTFFGRRIPRRFLFPWSIRLFRFFGAKVNCLGLGPNVRDRLDRVANMYAGMKSCNALFEYPSWHEVSLLESAFVCCIVLDESRGYRDSMIGLMTDYLCHKLVPKRAIRVVRYSRNPRKKLHRIIDLVRRAPPLNEKLVKFVIFGSKSVTGQLEEMLRRMIPGTADGLSGFLNGSTVFFSSVRDVPPRRLSFFEWQLLHIVFFLVIHLFPKMRIRMIRWMLRRLPTFERNGDDEVSTRLRIFLRRISGRSGSFRG